MRIIERTGGHYEVRDVPFGRVYRWRPPSVAVECSCGTRQDLTASTTVCGECGADHASAVQEELAAQWLDDETAHPWRHARDPEGGGLPF
jgi:hypothetical protein